MLARTNVASSRGPRVNIARPSAPRANLASRGLVARPPGHAVAPTPPIERIDVVEQYGAIADGQVGQTTFTLTASATDNLTTSVALFDPADIGKLITVQNTVEGDILYVGTIAGFTNSTTITVSPNPPARSMATYAWWGTDNASAFQQLNADFQGQDLAVILAPGIYVYSGGPPWGAGLQSLDMEAHGAAIAGGFAEYGGGNPYGQGPTQAEVNTVNVGATTATLQDVSQLALFNVGRWAMLCSLDVQGYGFPPNVYNVEYVQITANDGVDTVTFTPAAQFQHRATFPLYSPGTPTSASSGGPAMLYQLNDNWNVDVTFRGLQIMGNYGRGINSSARSLTLIDCLDHALNVSCLNLSGTKDIRVVNCDFSHSSFEIDKCIQSLSIESGSNIASAFTQSANPILLSASDSHLGQGPAARNAQYTNCTIGFVQMGVGYGRVESLTVVDCTVGEFRAPAPGGQAITDYQFMGNGVFRWSKGNFNLLAWECPSSPGRVPAQGWINGTFYAEYRFAILDVYDGGDGFIYCQTDIPGSDWPPTLGRQDQGGLRYLGPHLCPSYLVGTAGDQARPWGEYSIQQVTGDKINTTAPTLGALMVGDLVYVKINVTKPYAGSNPLTLRVFASGQPQAVRPDRLDRMFYDPIVNLKVAGERTIEPALISGLQSGDSGFTPAPGVWHWGGAGGVQFSRAIDTEPPADWPQFSIEMLADQGLAPGALSLEGGGFLLLEDGTSRLVLE